jgi:hypothetical protein
VEISFGFCCACDIMHNRSFRAGDTLSDAPKSPPESSGKGNENGDLPGSSSDQATSGWPATIALLGRVGGIGWFVGTSIALGSYGGYWLDRQFETAPVLTIVGLALGVATAFVGMFRLLSAIRRGR